MFRIAPYIALALAWLGYFSPWIMPTPVALRLTGYDLVEWLSFAQTVRDGTFAVTRVDMVLPLMMIALLFVTQDLTGLKRPVRSLLIGLALINSFLILPSYPFILTAHADPELRPQLIAGVIAFVGVGLMVALAMKSPRWAERIGGVIAVGGIVFTIRAYALASPVIADILTRSAPIGYGIILAVSGFVIYFALSLIYLYGKMREMRV
ncbi:MAG: hypothetical protein HZB17_05655 [Chloroflexi bacterium]|nr:hypothetical protein [Chloroflexota bacterium]